MGHRGVVDRQNLKELLSCDNSPIDHLLKVEEVAHAEVIITAHREHGNGHTRSAPCRTGIDETHSAHNERRTLVLGYYVHHSIVAVLPGEQLTGSLVKNHKLVTERQMNLLVGKRYAPFREIAVVHHQGIFGIPLADCLVVAAQCKHLIGAHHRSVDTQCHRSWIERL